MKPTVCGPAALHSGSDRFGTRPLTGCTRTHWLGSLFLAPRLPMMVLRCLALHNLCQFLAIFVIGIAIYKKGHL